MYHPNTENLGPAINYSKIVASDIKTTPHGILEQTKLETSKVSPVKNMLGGNVADQTQKTSKIKWDY